MIRRFRYGRLRGSPHALSLCNLHHRNKQIDFRFLCIGSNQSYVIGIPRQRPPAELAAFADPIKVLSYKKALFQLLSIKRQKMDRGFYPQGQAAPYSNSPYFRINSFLSTVTSAIYARIVKSRRIK